MVCESELTIKGQRPQVVKIFKVFRLQYVMLFHGVHFLFHLDACSLFMSPSVCWISLACFFRHRRCQAGTRSGRCKVFSVPFYLVPSDLLRALALIYIYIHIYVLLNYILERALKLALESWADLSLRFLEITTFCTVFNGCFEGLLIWEH